MKRTLIFFIILLIISCNKQNDLQNSYRAFYDKHEHDEHVTTFNMIPFIFKLFIDNHDKSTKDAVNQIETIAFLINENTDGLFKKDLDKHLPDKYYKTILKIKDHNSQIRFLAKENNESVVELIMIAEEGKNCVIMNIEGAFKKEDIKNFSEKINVDDLIKYRI